MKKGFCILGRVIGGLLLAAVLSMGVCTGAAGQTTTYPPSTSQSSGTTTTGAVAGIDDKTYMSSGVESLVGLSAFFVRAEDVKNTSGLRAYLKAANTRGTVSVLGTLGILQKKLPLSVRTGEGSDAALSAGVASLLNAIIRRDPELFQIAPFLRNPRVPAGTLAQIEQDRREQRVQVDLAFMPGTPGAQYFTVRTNVLNLLAGGTQEDLDKLAGNATALEAAATDFKRQLPPAFLNTYGARFEGGTIKPGYLPEITHSDSLVGYDVSLGGLAGSRSGVSIAFKKDLSPARQLTAYYLNEIYQIKKILQGSRQNALREIQEYISKIAAEYPKMSMAPRISAFANYVLADGGTVGANGRYSAINGGVSASLLRPFRGRGGSLTEPHSSAGIAGLLSANELLVLPGGGTSAHATRISAALWLQDLVPYYIKKEDRTVFHNTRYVFDHWHFRMGAEISNKTRFDDGTAWDVFIRFRTLPTNRQDIPTQDLVRQDTLFTVAAGRAGDRSTVVSFRIDRPF